MTIIYGGRRVPERAGTELLQAWLDKDPQRFYRAVSDRKGWTVELCRWSHEGDDFNGCRKGYYVSESIIRAGYLSFYEAMREAIEEWAEAYGEETMKIEGANVSESPRETKKRQEYLLKTLGRDVTNEIVVSQQRASTHSEILEAAVEALIRLAEDGTAKERRIADLEKQCKEWEARYNGLSSVAWKVVDKFFAQIGGEVCECAKGLCACLPERKERDDGEGR